MTETKRQQLIEAGQLHPDGSRIQVCPTCLRPFGEGEGLPEGSDGGDAVAQPDPAAVATEQPEV